jgi:hypothetical protein
MAEPAYGVSLELLRNPRCQWRCNILTYPSITAALLKHVVNLRPIPILHKDYYPKYIPGRGVGLFAARSFDVGETIIFERPIIIMARAMIGELDTVSRLWEGFTAEERLNLSLLFNRHKEDADRGQLWEFGIVRTNAFGFPTPTPHWSPKEVCSRAEEYNLPADMAWLHSMLFLDTSRLNHSWDFSIARIGFYLT